MNLRTMKAYLSLCRYRCHRCYGPTQAARSFSASPVMAWTALARAMRSSLLLKSLLNSPAEHYTDRFGDPRAVRRVDQAEPGLGISRDNCFQQLIVAWRVTDGDLAHCSGTSRNAFSLQKTASGASVRSTPGSGNAERFDIRFSHVAADTPRWNIEHRTSKSSWSTT